MQFPWSLIAHSGYISLQAAREPSMCSGRSTQARQSPAAAELLGPGHGYLGLLFPAVFPFKV